VFSARVRLIKPEPAIFELAAQRFAAAPGELLFFDDVAVNVDAARRAGWNAHHFTDAADCEAELRRRGLL
jgi:HAD superfamily hydrolase (TIGR01509 family)